jgi:hypothetical protein
MPRLERRNAPLVRLKSDFRVPDDPFFQPRPLTSHSSRGRRHGRRLTEGMQRGLSSEGEGSGAGKHQGEIHSLAVCVCEAPGVMDSPSAQDRPTPRRGLSDPPAPQRGDAGGARRPCRQRMNSGENPKPYPSQRSIHFAPPRARSSAASRSSRARYCASRRHRSEQYVGRRPRGRRRMSGARQIRQFISQYTPFSILRLNASGAPGVVGPARPHDPWPPLGGCGSEGVA